MMSEVVCTKSQEEYEDDFEKDLDWLISEEGRDENQGPNYKDIEAEIDKELQEDHEQIIKRRDKNHKEERRETLELEGDERWPSPMEPLECYSDRDSPSSSSDLVPPPPGIDEQTDEEKKYILEKIQQANRELQDQEAPDMTRRRRLHFKETLVDLVVPPMPFDKEKGSNEEMEGQKNKKDNAKETQEEGEVSGKLSELNVSQQEDILSGADQKKAGDSCEGGMEAKEGRVLVEKDGKFDLVSLKEVESQGLLPPILNSDSTHSLSSISSKKHSASFSPRSIASQFHSKKDADKMCTPKPPSQPRVRPSSANHSLRVSQGRSTKRRVQSAIGLTCQTTFTLSPQQKEMLIRIQEKKEKLAKEAEEKKREEEEQKRQENELAYKAWLMRKREQFQGEKRVHRAQEMERMNCKKDTCDPEEAFRHWLQKKQEQQHKEKQLVALKKLEEDTSYLLRSKEDCERAFKQWLRRKRLEKQAEQQAARERSRRLVLEERQARRMRDLMCTVNDAKAFRFNEQLAYRF